VHSSRQAPTYLPLPAFIKSIQNILAILDGKLPKTHHPPSIKEGANIISGYLLCRLPNGTSEVRGLGKLMQQKRVDNKPRLVVREGVLQPQTFEIDQSVIENMISNSTFAMPSVQVVISHKLAVVDAVLRFDGDAGHSISGFPRSLVKQETRAMSKLPQKVAYALLF
jgi:hypothetical protein